MESPPLDRLVVSADLPIEYLFDRFRWPGSAIAPYASSLIGAQGICPADFDDICQELAVYVVRRWPTYDSRRASPKTFVDRLLKLKSAELRRKSRLRHQALATTAQYCGCETLRDASQSPNCDLLADLAVARDRLPVFERRIANLLSEYSPSEVARLLGIHRARVYEAIAKIRRRFEDAGLHIYVENSGRFRSAQHKYERKSA